MCLGAIYWARPKRVYYGATRQDAARSGFDDALIYEEAAKALSQRRIPMDELMREEALAAFCEWDALPVKFVY
jgi:tRNA(Arg) A34 adenosine deaminase TadA